MPRYLTRSQTARYIGVPLEDLDKLVTRGEIPGPMKTFSAERWDAQSIHLKYLCDEGFNLGKPRN